jgi:hypothetical protein
MKFTMLLLVSSIQYGNGSKVRKVIQQLVGGAADWLQQRLLLVRPPC